MKNTYNSLREIANTNNGKIFEYLDNAGKPVKMPFTTIQGDIDLTHAEQHALTWFNTNNIPKSRVTRIYSELEPCELASQCKQMLNTDFAQAQVYYSFKYPGSDNAAIGVIQYRKQALENRFYELIDKLK